MKVLIAILSLITFLNIAHAAETVGEKVEAKTNNVKREIKGGAHRVAELTCEKTDKNCFAKKANNRATEAKDYTSDKTSEVINIMDDDKQDGDKNKRKKQ